MIITSRKNEIVVKSRRILSEKKIRDKEGAFGVEGFKLTEEAIKAGLSPLYAVVTVEALEKFPQTIKLIEKNCSIYTVSNEVYLSISEQKSPQGIFLAGKILDKFKIADIILTNNKILMLDAVQDMGNLGTMFRTAEALGIDAVILGEGCADAWSPKTLRGSMGSVFRLPFCCCSLSEAVDLAKENGFQVYAAMLDNSAKPLGSFKFPQKSAVIIGNEGHGISPEIAEKSQKLYIPIQKSESLNAAAAAAVICWKMTKE